MADLPSNILEFCAILREECGIEVGHAQAHDALRSVETIGVRDREALRYALRLVCCSKPEHLEPFDTAFERFFGNAACGMPQPHHARTQGDGESDKTPRGTRREVEDEATGAASTRTLRARFSAFASEARTNTSVPAAGLEEHLHVASRLLATLRLGRSRRFRPRVHGSRFDVRRTLRASLRTGGEPVSLRTLGHPFLNPRIALLIDASRSMAEYTPQLLQLAYALCRRSRRVRVFTFSTKIREITRDLRGAAGAARSFDLPGEAWGGGTRIGESLQTFARSFAASVDGDTAVVIASDGFDLGDSSKVADAMRRIYRRAAGVLWLNPHASRPDFEPEAKGMRAAMPYVNALLDASDLQSVVAAARHIRR